MSNFTPAWFKKGFFNESLFCDDFLSTHQLLYSNGAFFTPDGRMVDPMPLRCEIFEMMREYVGANLAKKVTNVVDVLKLAAQALQEGRPPADGLGFGARMAGFLVQRMWFGLLAGRCTGKLKINADTCVGCGKCAAGCPMENLRMEEGKAEAGKNCTLCYRCVNRCPAQAITLLGKRVVKQNDIAKYVTGDAEDSGKASFPFAGKE